MATTRVDLHAKVLDERVVERAKARGLDALVYAPHFTRWPDARDAAARFTDEDLLVVPGREIFTGSWRDRKHVLALDLETPVPDYLTLEATMAELERQDAVVLVPHPTFLTVSLSPADLRRYRDRIDALEVYNPKHWRHHNRRARELAASLSLAPFGSSYAHRWATVGEAWTDIEASVDGPAALHDALRGDIETTPRHRRGPHHEARCAVEFAHLGWENSWLKARRVLDDDLEPTHPRHPAYEGRFDDSAVY